MRIKGWLRRHLGLLVPVAALAVGWGAPTHAALVTIDFGTGETQDVASPYQEDGFNVVGSDLLLVDVGNPARSILLDLFTSTLTISRIAGDPFSLVSFDSLCAVSSCTNNINVQGVLSGGGSIGPTTVSSGSSFTTASAFADFANLSTLTISIGSGASSYIDNIVLNVIPLPAALPLLATALAGLGLAWRRAQCVGT